MILPWENVASDVSSSEPVAESFVSDVTTPSPVNLTREDHMFNILPDTFIRSTQNDITGTYKYSENAFTRLFQYQLRMSSIL